jgi:hypothetical protein
MGRSSTGRGFKGSAQCKKGSWAIDCVQLCQEAPAACLLADKNVGFFYNVKEPFFKDKKSFFLKKIFTTFFFFKKVFLYYTFLQKKIFFSHLFCFLHPFKAATAISPRKQHAIAQGQLIPWHDPLAHTNPSGPTTRP